MEDPFAKYFNSYQKDKQADLSDQGLPARLKSLEKDMATIDAELAGFKGKDGLTGNTNGAFLSPKEEEYYNKLMQERDKITEEMRHVQGDIFITKTDSRN